MLAVLHILRQRRQDLFDDVSMLSHIRESTVRRTFYAFCDHADQQHTHMPLPTGKHSYFWRGMKRARSWSDEGSESERSDEHRGEASPGISGPAQKQARHADPAGRAHGSPRDGGKPQPQPQPQHDARPVLLRNTATLMETLKRSEVGTAKMLEHVSSLVQLAADRDAEAARNRKVADLLELIKGSRHIGDEATVPGTRQGLIEFLEKPSDGASQPSHADNGPDPVPARGGASAGAMDDPDGRPAAPPVTPEVDADHSGGPSPLCGAGSPRHTSDQGAGEDRRDADTDGGGEIGRQAARTDDVGKAASATGSSASPLAVDGTEEAVIVCY